MCGQGWAWLSPLERSLWKEREGEWGKWWDWRPINYCYFTELSREIVPMSLDDKRKDSMSSGISVMSKGKAPGSPWLQAQMAKWSGRWRPQTDAQGDYSCRMPRRSCPSLLFSLPYPLPHYPFSIHWDASPSLIIGNGCGAREYWGDSEDSRGQWRERRRWRTKYREKIEEQNVEKSRQAVLLLVPLVK